MKKAEQLKINALCEKVAHKALDELSMIQGVNGNEVSYEDFMKMPPIVKRLRSCSAKVFTTNNYYILQSYQTIIAVIDRNTDTLYDFLRIACGYTHTSAQHIAKFGHDYCSGSWNCSKVYTAR